MKRIEKLAIVWLLVLVATAILYKVPKWNEQRQQSWMKAWADTFTTRMSLTKPSIGSTNWGTNMNNNLDSLDSLAPTVVSKSAGYTLVQADMGSVIAFNCSSACTATITDSLSSIWFAEIVSVGAGQVTVSRQTSGTINGLTSLPPLTQYQGVTVFSNGANAYYATTGGGRDFPDVKVIPAAECNNATAGPAWDLPATNAPTAACQAGTNNLGGVLQWANNNTTTNAQFGFELPADWDSAKQPYITIFYSSGANTSGTVKWTFSTECTKSDGSVSDDGAFNAESATTGNTMAAANRQWSESIQFTAVTSGNNCIPGGTLRVKVTSGNGTATSTVNVKRVTITTPRLLTVQAN